MKNYKAESRNPIVTKEKVDEANRCGANEEENKVYKSRVKKKIDGAE